MGMDLFSVVKGMAEGTSFDERREGEFIGGEGMLEHVGVEEEGSGGHLGEGTGLEDSVEEEGVGVGEAGEDSESVAEVVVGGEGDDARHGVVVGGEAKAEE